MTLFRSTIAIAFACVLTFAQTKATDPSSQTQDPLQSMVIRIDVNLVQVDAVVTDSDGNPVTDLTADDFTVIQDGKTQKITNFSFVKARPRIVRTVSVAKPAPRGAAPAPISPPKPLAPSEARRVVALVVDDLGISFRTSVRVRDSLKDWVDNKMEPGDLVAIVQTGMGMGVLQQFTDDKRMLYAAIDRVRYNTMGRVGSEEMSSNVLNSEHEIALTLGSLGSIQYVLEGLKALPGRKSLIIFSDSLKMKFKGDSNMVAVGQEDLVVRDTMQRLIESANRSSVVIHTIDAKGLVVLLPSGNPEDPVSYSAPMEGLLDSQDAMVVLAKATGGLFVQNRNDIDKSLQEVVEDGEAYYLLGYQPDEDVAAEMKSGKIKFHDIRVRINRRGLRVRTRTGFLGTPEKPTLLEDLSPEQRIAQSLYSPFASGSLKIRLTAMFAQNQAEKMGVNALLHFDATNLAFLGQPDDFREAVVDIVAATFDPDGKQIDISDKRWTIRVKDAEYKRMLRDGISFLIHVPVTKPGPYQMRAVVVDTNSGEMGNATQYIEVPDIDSGKLALSGILLSEGDLKNKNEAEQAEGVIRSENPKGTAAIRMFEPGATLSWVYQVLNAKTDRDNKPSLQAQIRLFRDGKEIYEGEPSTITSEIPPKSKRIVVSGKMQLKQASPGEYALQVVVTDKLAKNRMAAQSIDFEVIGK